MTTCRIPCVPCRSPVSRLGPHILLLLFLSTRFAQAQMVFLPARVVAQIPTDDLPEASGLAASWAHEDVLWTHNDSGEGPYLHALRKSTGAYLGRYHLGVKNTDLEDIAVGVGPKDGWSYVYVGDIGNNDKGKPSRDRIRVHRLAEPPVPENGETVRLDGVGVDTITLKYPSNRDYIDAETLMIDPVDERIYIVEKTRNGETSPIYSTPSGTTHREGSFSLDLEYKGDVANTEWLSGGDISKDGSEILLKRYHRVFYWRRNGYDSVADAIIDQAYAVQPYSPEVQGEAICFDPDGEGYYTISEGKARDEIPLLFYPRRRLTPAPVIPQPTKPPSSRAPTTPRPTVTPVTRRPTGPPTSVPSESPITTGPTVSPSLSPTESPTTAVPSSGPTAFPSDYPSAFPSISPSQNPSDSPSVSPTHAIDTAARIADNGYPADLYPLPNCRGDCDDDDDCQEGLMCFQRDKGDAIPGCQGNLLDDDDTDICIVASASPTQQPTLPPTESPITLHPSFVNEYVAQAADRAPPKDPQPALSSVWYHVSTPNTTTSTATATATANVTISDISDSKSDEMALENDKGNVSHVNTWYHITEVREGDDGNAKDDGDGGLTAYVSERAVGEDGGNNKKEKTGGLYAYLSGHN